MAINPDEIKRADILLVRTKRNFLSWIIRKATTSDWNHVAVFVSKDDQWPKWTIEALGKGIVSMPFELSYMHVLRDAETGKILKITENKNYKLAIIRIQGLTYEDGKAIAFKAYNWAYEKRPYDYLLLTIGMLGHLATGRKWRPRWLNRSQAFICSELVATAYREVTGIQFGKAGYVTPGDFAKAVEKLNDIEIVMESG